MGSYWPLRLPVVCLKWYYKKGMLMEIQEDDLIVISNAAVQYALANMDRVVIRALARIGDAMCGPGDVVVRKDRQREIDPEVQQAIDNTSQLHARFMNGEFYG